MTLEIDAELETVDLSDYRSAAGAAKATHERVSAEAETLGFDADYVSLWDREKTKEMRGTDAWTVVFEGGPYDWAIHMAGGESMYGANVSPEVEGFYSSTEWSIECPSSFAIEFYPEA